MLACIVYAFGAGSLYRLNANDRYQSRFLAGGVAAAVLMSSPHLMVSLPHFVDFKSWVTGMITFSLLLSTAFHYLNPKWRTRSAEVSENTDEKLESLDIVDLLFVWVSSKGRAGRPNRQRPTIRNFLSRGVSTNLAKEFIQPY